MQDGTWDQLIEETVASDKWESFNSEVVKVQSSLVPVPWSLMDIDGLIRVNKQRDTKNCRGWFTKRTHSARVNQWVQ